MLYVPYILRALRLLQIWRIHKAELKNEVCDDAKARKPSTFLINERNLNRMLAAILIPIAILCFVSSFKTKIELYLPFFGISECSGNPDYTGYYEDINVSMRQYTIAQFFRNSVFITLIFLLREVDDTFNITNELRMVVLFSIVCEQTYLCFLLFFGGTMFVIMGWVVYLQIALCMGLMYWTAVEPLLATYKPSSIIPFSLNKECISNVESAMIQETSSRYFFNFLVQDLKDERGIVLFALYSDLRRFMVLCDDKQTSKEELTLLAKQIFNDYIEPGSDF